MVLFNLYLTLMMHCNYTRVFLSSLIY